MSFYECRFVSKDRARNWWGAAWAEKMERLAEPTRFAEGERYARTGFLPAIRFDGRTVAARVQAPHEPPYIVRISFDPFSREQWECLLAEVRDRNALAFEKRSIAMRTVRYAVISIFCLARHIDVAPTGAGRDDHGAASELCTTFEFDLRFPAELSFHLFAI